MTARSIAIASDHGGFPLKVGLASHLRGAGFDLIDLGVDTLESVDYPDFAQKLAEVLSQDKNRFGVLLCGTGIGVSIAANRYRHIRAALVHDAFGARLARQHNDANVIVFGGRVLGLDLAIDCLDVFLATDFAGGRHARRVQKMS